MTREEKIAEAQRLRAEGWTQAAIGERLGVTPSCVHKWLNPERAREYSRRDCARPERKAAKREWEEAHRPVCACGKPMALGGDHKGVLRCRECWAREVHAPRQQRRERIAAMWRDGMSLRDIAAAIGSTRNRVQVEVTMMRRDGWDMPYRHRGYGKYAAPVDAREAA